METEKRSCCPSTLLIRRVAAADRPPPSMSVIVPTHPLYLVARSRRLDIEPDRDGVRMMDGRRKDVTGWRRGRSFRRGADVRNPIAAVEPIALHPLSECLFACN